MKPQAVPPTLNYLFAGIDDAERAVCEDLKRSCSIDSDHNLVRSALYHFALHVLGKANVSINWFGMGPHIQIEKPAQPRRKGSLREKHRTRRR